MSLIVPCWNETRRIDLEKFVSFAPAWPDVELVLVDDGSDDGTAELLARIAAERRGSTQVVPLGENLGKAEAVRRGMRLVLDRSPAERPDAVGFWDADLATPWSELAAFCEVLSRRPEIDMVFGARVKLQGRVVDRNEWRHYAGRVFATVVANLLRLPIYDTQCGAKLFRLTPTLDAVFASPFVTGWLFDVEILARFMALDHDRSPDRLVYEHPLEEWRDRPGSKVGWRGYLRSLLDLVRLCRTYRLPRRRGGRPRFETRGVAGRAGPPLG